MNTTVPATARLHDIYRMRDLSGRLLYIGVTNGGLRRFMEHAKDKTWWREVAQIDIEHVHCSRTVIEALERDAIRDEKPLYNVVHNRGAEIPPPVYRSRSHRDRIADQAASIWDHVCADGGSCPLLDEVRHDVDRAYFAITDGQREWVDTQAQAWGLNPQRFGQLAVLIHIATDDRFALDSKTWDNRLRQIMAGGWGAPLDCFNEVSAADCITILHTYFMDDIVGDRHLCTIAQAQAAAIR